MQDVTILYDIENSPMEMLAYALEKAKERSAPVVRIYSDWTICSSQKKWQDFFHQQEAQFIQVGRSAQGKNSLDQALFDAALTMAEQENKCFIVVTSDTDFIKLVQTLHQKSDICVIGIGCNKNNDELKAAYDEFYQYAPGLVKKHQIVDSAIPSDDIVTEKLREIFCELSEGGEWVMLGDMGNLLKKKYPKFKFPINYPARLKNVMDLHHAQFETRQDGTILYVREKNIATDILNKMELKSNHASEPGEIEMKLRWEMALLMLHEGIDSALVRKITDLSAVEIHGMEKILTKIKG